MPHITVEYSSNLEDGVSVRRLVDNLHQTVIDSGLFELPAIRTRALPRSVYRIADGNPDNLFLHIIARIRAGRSVEERKRLGSALLRDCQVGARHGARPIALGIEIHEIDPKCSSATSRSKRRRRGSPLPSIAAGRTARIAVMPIVAAAMADHARSCSAARRCRRRVPRRRAGTHSGYACAWRAGRPPCPRLRSPRTWRHARPGP